MTLKRVHLDFERALERVLERVLEEVTPKSTWCDTDKRAAVFGKIAA